MFRVCITRRTAALKRNTELSVRGSSGEKRQVFKGDKRISIRLKGIG